jgi:ribosome biogenesis GTPase YqeH
MTEREKYNEQPKAVAEQCAGCGIPLQTDDPDALGYVPAATQNKETAVCRRCYRIRHYNEISSTALHQEDFLKILNHVGRTDSLVVHIVDIFDFEGSLISGLRRFVAENQIVLAVNKVDLLPKAINPNKIVNWIQRQTKDHGLKVDDIILCSAKKNIGFERVIQAIEQRRRGRDVYVVGATNVGKSTLINRLIRDYSDMDRELTTSPYPGTTLDMVKIPLEDGRHIIDTPGIVYSHRLTEIIPKTDLGAVMPDRPLKPLVYQLNEGQTLFLGALVRFDFVEGERQSFTCYISNALKVHRTKLERADELYNEHKGEMLAPPDKDHLNELPPLTKYTFRVKNGEQMDIAVSGLGWIKVNQTTGAVVHIHAPKGIKVALRHSMI